MSGRPPKTGDTRRLPDSAELSALTEASTIIAAEGDDADDTARLDSPVNSQLAEPSRYDDEGSIGTGGMGSVHAVYDRVLLRRVAMKTLHNSLADEEEHTQRFLEEVQITGQLDHPNIVPVHDVGFHSRGNAFFIMKLVQGETLSKLLSAQLGKPLGGDNLVRFLQIFLKICDALDFAHSRGVIHRDLKPSNIMVGSHGEVYVMDWGIALLYDSERDTRSPLMPQLMRPTESHRESAGSLMGTAAYMAPEQALSLVDHIDYRTDIFGLGAILYQIMTGRPPYVGENAAIQIEQASLGSIQPPEQAAADRRLPPGLCRIAMKAMARDRADRYQSVSELSEAVQVFLSGGGWFDVLEFAPGTIIVAEGDDADAAYIIEGGHCEVYKGAGESRQFLRKLGPGDVFGETAIFTGAPRTATVAALDQVRAACITRDSLDYELDQKGWFGTFVKALAERFCECDTLLSKLRARHPEP
ncbi:MAG: serine/threonine-protein kinase [Proteobacteria bacterium]|nr:serine/threonine-protein kinase [Pseudomonadota bacterium]